MLRSSSPALVAASRAVPTVGGGVTVGVFVLLALAIVATAADRWSGGAGMPNDGGTGGGPATPALPNRASPVVTPFACAVPPPHPHPHHSPPYPRPAHSVRPMPACV